MNLNNTNVKILVVDLKYDYGVKSRGVNAIGIEGMQKSFQTLGYKVFSFYYDEYLQNVSKLQLDLINYAEKIQPDFIFFSLYRDQFYLGTLDILKSKYITINWFGDDQWRFDDFTASYANHFTWCITTDKFALSKYIKLGQKNVIYSQWAAIDAHVIPNFESYKNDVTFVGGFHPYRKWFIDSLRGAGINIEVFGNGWPNGPLSGQEMNQLYANSKINLNISNSNSFDVRYLFSHWKAVPLLYKNSKNASQMKARNFEIPFFGGLQLTDYVPTVEDYFVIGKEILCYNNVDEASRLIKYYLQNDEEREKIKNMGHQRAINFHGYINRISSVMKEINEKS